MALKVYEESDMSENIFDINILNVNEYETQEELINVFKLQDGGVTSPLVQKFNMLNSFDKNKYLEDVSKNIEVIKENIDALYENIDDTNTPSRISVSELKKKENEEVVVINEYEIKDKLTDIELASDEDVTVEEKTKFLKPSILCDEKDTYTAVRKGILVHFILEHLDINISTKSELKDYINKMVLNNTINENDKKYINITRIYNFLNSKIGKDLKTSKKVFREYEFILKDKNISNSVIQGVIDLFYITNDGKVILVDFKTDRVFEEDVFIKRYKKQLDIYKEAIEKLLNYKVEKTYIYSFSMNKEIEIKEQ